MNYEFVNAQLMHVDNPDTFKIPSHYELNTITKDSFVKVCADFSKVVKHGITAERFWVKVIYVDGDEIHGKIDNELVFTKHHGLKYNDIIIFKKLNVYTVG